jgi:hypothetical protein
MESLPTGALPAVPHVTFLIFNLTIPNIIAWGTVIVVFFIAARLRLPRIF